MKVMPTRLWLTSTAGFVIAAMMSASAAHAQSGIAPAPQANVSDAGSQNATVPDSLPPSSDIVVTAQRRAQRLQDVPISASVIDGDALQRGDLRGLQDLSNHLPNVKIAQTPAGDALQIRGTGSGFNLGFEQSVAIFVDGLYRPRSRSSRAAVFDVSQVEVLKGPQTTFFGSNAIAGALNITTRKPSEKLEGNASALYGSDDQYDLQAGVGGPLTENLKARAAISISGMDGYTFNEKLQNKGPHLRDALGRLSLSWTPTSDIEVTGRVEHGRFRDKGIFNVELVNCPAPVIYGAPRGPCARSLAAGGGSTDGVLNNRTSISNSFFKLDYTEGMLNTTFNFEHNSLVLLTGYYDHDYILLGDNVPGAGGSAVGTPSGLPIRTEEHYRQWSQEVRFLSTGENSIDYMIGAYAMRGKLGMQVDSGFYFAPFGPIVGLPATTPIQIEPTNQQSDTTLSIFGAGTINLSQNFRVNLGLRYSVVDKNASRSNVIGIGAPLLDPATLVPLPLPLQATLAAALGTSLSPYPVGSRRDKKLMPSASVQYNVTTNAMAYASFAKGFKAGGYSFVSSNATFEPENVDAYEVGIKGSMFDRRVTYNLAGFYEKYTDLQEAITVVVGNTINSAVANAARSVSKGIELGVAVKVTPQLTLTTDLAYLKAFYVSYPNGTCTALQNLAPPCVQNLSGRPRAFAPKFSGNAALSYRTSLGDSGLRLTLEPSLYFTSSFYQSPTIDPLVRQSQNIKYDARIAIGRADGRWELAVIGKT